jgi:putative hemolysin
LGNRASGLAAGPDKPETIRFSYSTEDQPALQRALIRTIEFVGGQRRLYDRRNAARMPGETFFDAAVRLLALHVHLDEAALAAIPREGPLVFVANHPYGVLDGVVLTWLALKVRPDTRVLANGVLNTVPETKDYLLPVDFSETREARAVNIASRKAAQDWLNDGHAVGIFPGGGVSTSERPLRGAALDLPWAPFTAKLIRSTRATVVPVHFSGQNSRLFQIASHLSLTLRLSLIFRETARRIGTRLDVRIGQPIPFADLAHLSDRADLVAKLRRITFALAPQNHIDWMRHGRIKEAATSKAKVEKPRTTA